jgi:DNA-binding helix-hairpin-helix protein with protein kinase domain
VELQCQSNRERFTLNDQLRLGSGGEARVYGVHLAEGRRAVKVYHHEPAEMQVAKLRVMLAHPPDAPGAKEGHTSIAWPLDLVCRVDKPQRVVGFLMPWVTGVSPLRAVYTPGERRPIRPWFDYARLHLVARNLAAAVQALHARGYVIGDVREANIRVCNDGWVTLIDTDSFQVRASSGEIYRCPVGRPEYTPPELQGRAFDSIDRRPEHDRFGLAVLIFRLLMEGWHPFDGCFQGRGAPPLHGERIQKGHFPYGSRPGPYTPPPYAPPFSIVDPALQDLFCRCFEAGHDCPQARPEAHTWCTALDAARARLTPCTGNAQHVYGRHLDACPWCEHMRRLPGGWDPFPPPVAVSPTKLNPWRAVVVSLLVALWVSQSPGAQAVLSGLCLVLLLFGWGGLVLAVVYKSVRGDLKL